MEIDRIENRLQADQLRDALAVIRRVAKRELRRLCALEEEVQVVLPGEADAAVELDAGARRAIAGVRAGAFEAAAFDVPPRFIS